MYRQQERRVAEVQPGAAVAVVVPAQHPAACAPASPQAQAPAQLGAAKAQHYCADEPGSHAGSQANSESTFTQLAPGYLNTSQPGPVGPSGLASTASMPQPAEQSLMQDAVLVPQGWLHTAARAAQAGKRHAAEPADCFVQVAKRRATDPADCLGSPSKLHSLEPAASMSLPAHEHAMQLV